MELIKVVCPSCNGELNLSKASGFIFCNYCGNKFSLPQVEDKPNIHNYLKLANNSLALGITGDAIDYFNKVLEHEPNNYEAMIGKGHAIFKTSTLKNPKFLEMVAMFMGAFKQVPEEKKGEAAFDIKKRTLEASISLFETAYSHFNKFRGTSPNVSNDFHNICTMIIIVIDEMLKLSADHRTLNKELCDYGIKIVNTTPTFNLASKSQKNQEYKKRIENDKMWVVEKANQEKRLQQKKYWEEHPKEYQIHLEKTETAKNKLISEIETKRSKLRELKTQSSMRIEELTKQRNSLGILSVNKKKEIDNEIELINSRLSISKDAISHLLV